MLPTTEYASSFFYSYLLKDVYFATPCFLACLLAADADDFFYSLLFLFVLLLGYRISGCGKPMKINSVLW